MLSRENARNPTVFAGNYEEKHLILTVSRSCIESCRHDDIFPSCKQSFDLNDYDFCRRKQNFYDCLNRNESEEETPKIQNGSYLRRNYKSKK